MLKSIKNNEQHKETLERIYLLMQKNIQPNSKQSDALEVLSMLVKEYESTHFPLPKPTPLEAIKFRLEQTNLAETDLAAILGITQKD